MTSQMNSNIPAEALERVFDRETLFIFLRDYLSWPVDSEDTFTYSGPLLADEIATRVQVSRIVPFGVDDPFLIMLAEFQTPLRRTDLREILRAIRAEIRKQAKYEGMGLEDIVFVCTTEAYSGIRFAHFEEQDGRQPKLSVFGWDRLHIEETRTLRQENLPALAMPPRNLFEGYNWALARDKWLSAWNVEAVTDKFFRDYRFVFEEVEVLLQNQIVEPVTRRDFTQRLFNRLMFVHFLSKKGWLTYNDNHRYLRELFIRSEQDGVDLFFHDRLYWLFFHGLGHSEYADAESHNTPELIERRGEVPFLNGGLFNMEDELDVQGAVTIPDSAFASILDLFERYNFTITESTPLDIEVAVDPEMLGKVFEELVTGRHESGSYYTPRPVVAFMCREALKQYLGGGDAIGRFVDEYDASLLPNPEDVLESLKRVRVCDPACGSGAYLLGMLQELLSLRKALFTSKQIDAIRDYQRKLEIIQSTLYGVDLDPFAVNTARLRLWLSLVVDSDRPVPLPNLDFKIECGDSLAAPNPQEMPNLFRHLLITQADELARIKGEFMLDSSMAKPEMKRRILALESELASSLADVHMPDGAFDWRVRFAEVFKDGGFDIVLANPPYVRQELIGGQKPYLMRQYSAAVDGKSDLYCYFYVRALQLLRPGGMHVFICSNSWLDVSYGGKLQGYLLKNAHLQAIYESAIERQFSTAEVNTIISFIRNSSPDDKQVTRFISLHAPFESAITDSSQRKEVQRTHAELWEAGLGEPNRVGSSSYEGDKWGAKFLRAPDIYQTMLEKGKNRLLRLGDIAEVRRGFTTGCNDFFLLDEASIKRWGIEQEYFAPILESPRGAYGIVISPDIYGYIFLCSKERTEILGTAAYRYIQWGESQGYQKCLSCIPRRNWYDLGRRKPSDCIWPRTFFERHICYSPRQPVYCSDRFYSIILNQQREDNFLLSYLNSTIVSMMVEVNGYHVNHGGIDTSVWWLKSLPVPSEVPADAVEAYNSICARDILLCEDELNQPDRQALDRRVLELMGIADADEALQAIYQYVRASVSGRIHKARRGTTQRGRRGDASASSAEEIE